MTNQQNNTLNQQRNKSLLQTQAVYQALVDAIIPRTPRLAEEYEEVQFFGALDLHTDEYMINTLNHYYFPLAKPVADLLDVVAGGSFAALSKSNRFRALLLLENLEMVDFPEEYQEVPEFILSITSSLNRYTMMGYYSEWYGYGTTRLEEPNRRILEFTPLSWEQVGYPGPSFSYLAYVQEYNQHRGEFYE